MGFNVWGPTEADSWPVGRPRGAEKRGLVYICIYVYTGVGVGRTELVVGWYSMTVPPARIRCIADFYADPAEEFIKRRSSGESGLRTGQCVILRSSFKTENENLGQHCVGNRECLGEKQPVPVGFPRKVGNE